MAAASTVAPPVLDEMLALRFVYEAHEPDAVLRIQRAGLRVFRVLLPGRRCSGAAGTSAALSATL
jgi:hypothetical protein